MKKYGKLQKRNVSVKRCRYVPTAAPEFVGGKPPYHGLFSFTAALFTNMSLTNSGKYI